MTCDNVLGERADKTLEAKDDKAEDCMALLCDGLWSDDESDLNDPERESIKEGNLFLQ